MRPPIHQFLKTIPHPPIHVECAACVLIAWRGRSVCPCREQRRRRGLRNKDITERRDPDRHPMRRPSARLLGLCLGCARSERRQKRDAAPTRRPWPSRSSPPLAGPRRAFAPRPLPHSPGPYAPPFDTALRILQYRLCCTSALPCGLRRAAHLRDGVESERRVSPRIHAPVSLPTGQSGQPPLGY